MSLLRVLPVILLMLVALAAVLLGAQRLVSAQTRLAGMTASLRAAACDAQEIAALRARQERVARHERPAQDVIAQVNAALAEVGIPASVHFRNLTPEIDGVIPASAISGSSDSSGTLSAGQYRRQTLRIALDGLTLRELGAFLLHWRESQHIWTVARLELTHSRVQNQVDFRGGSGSNSSDQSESEGDRFDASVLITAIYAAED